MVKLLRNISLAILLSQWVGFEVSAMDRHVLVEATHAQFCSLVNHVLLSLQPTDRLFQQATFLRQIRSICQSANISLVFVKNFEGYVFVNAASNRFMGTTSEVNSPILVSNELLNRSDFASNPMKPINLILQTLMHEYANKLKDVDQATKDLVAREFAKYIFPFEQEFSQDGLKVHWLSVPVLRIDKDFAKTQSHQPQPSFLLLASNGETVIDLTEAATKELAHFTPGLRSTWTESNRMALFFFTQISRSIPQLIESFTAQLKSDAIRNQLRAEARRKGIPEEQIGEFDIDGMVKGFNDFAKIFSDLESEEMRLFEIHQVRLVSTSEKQWEMFVTAVFALNRSKVDELKRKQKEMGANFSFDQEGGFGIKKIIQVPLMIRLKMNDESSSGGRFKVVRIDADLRPDLNLDRVAKVGQISRSGALVKTIKVKLGLESGNPKIAHLRLSGGASSLLVAASKIQEERKNLYIFEFDLPDDLDKNSFPMMAESVVIDQSKSYMVDRVVQVNEGSGTPIKKPLPQLITPGIVVRDLNNSLSVAPVFHPFMPVLLMNKNWYNFMTRGGHRDEMESSRWIDLDNLELRFGITGGAKIRQVRLQMSYDIIVGRPDEKDLANSYSGQVDVDGQILPVWSQVSHKDQEQLYQQIVFDKDNIRTRDSSEMTVVTARMKIPFLPLPRPFEKGFGYGPPMVRPLKIDVVLDDEALTTVSYVFPEIKDLDCEEILRNMKFDFSR